MVAYSAIHFCFSLAVRAAISKQARMCFSCLEKKTSTAALRVHQNCAFSIALCAGNNDPLETFVAIPDKLGSRLCFVAHCVVNARYVARAFKTSASFYATQKMREVR